MLSLQSGRLDCLEQFHIFYILLPVVKGFHLRYEDEKLDDVIKSWNVKSISVSSTIFSRSNWKTYNQMSTC